MVFPIMHLHRGGAIDCQNSGSINNAHIVKLTAEKLQGFVLGSLSTAVRVLSTQELRMTLSSPKRGRNARHSSVIIRQNKLVHRRTLAPWGYSRRG